MKKQRTVYMTELWIKSLSPNVKKNRKQTNR